MDNIKVAEEAAKPILQQQNLVGLSFSPPQTAIQQKPFKNIMSQQEIEQPLQPVQEANTRQKDRKRGKRGGDPVKKCLRIQKFFYTQKCNRYLNMVGQQGIEQPLPPQASIQQKPFKIQPFENITSHQGIEQPLQPVQEANAPQKDKKRGKRGGDPFKRFIHNQKFFYTQKYNHYRNMKIMATKLVKLVTALDKKTVEDTCERHEK